MKKKIKYSFCVFIAILILIPIGFGLTFPSTSKLVICLITRRLPDSGHLSRIRKDLQSQESFINMLVKHERIAAKRFSEKRESFFVKKYIHKTPTSMFDIHSLHDFWEVWVRTDIVDGKPLTSFLIRLGLVKDTNAADFFSDQCSSGFCKAVMKSVLTLYNQMFDWGIFKPIRLNITEMDETSSISRQRLPLKVWIEMVGQIHGKGRGIGFRNFRRNSE